MNVDWRNFFRSQELGNGMLFVLPALNYFLITYINYIYMDFYNIKCTIWIYISVGSEVVELQILGSY
jgi:hypothetical protein